MIKFRLRTLLVASALLPPVIAVAWQRRPLLAGLVAIFLLEGLGLVVLLAILIPGYIKYGRRR
jgi:hypothetical protein